MTPIRHPNTTRLLIAALASITLTMLSAGTVVAQTIETTGKQAILIDLTTNTVLMQKNADERMPPASMSKLMTVYMIFDRLKSGRLSMDDKFLVSEKAWRKGGSKMFVMVNTRVSVHDLLQGIIVQSGNDACIVAAEGIAGSEEAFAEMENRKAKEIGLKNSHFENATGWPAEGHYMTARDLATLATRIIREFPEYYSIFAEKNFTYNKIKQGNRNPLLYKDFGADGLKTGHTEASGYGLVASAVRHGRRLLLVINGLSSMRERSSESARVLDWGFRETDSYALFKKGDTVDQADVWLGKAPSVPLVVDRALTVTLPRRARRDMKVKLSYSNPINAPITKGAPVGHVTVTVPGRSDMEVPVVAGKSVDRLGLFGRLNAAFQYLVWGRSQS